MRHTHTSDEDLYPGPSFSLGQFPLWRLANASVTIAANTSYVPCHGSHSVDRFLRPRSTEKVKHRKDTADLFIPNASGEIVTRKSQVSPSGVLRLGIHLPRRRVLFLERYCMNGSGPSGHRTQRELNFNTTSTVAPTCQCCIELFTCEAPAR